MVYRNVADFLGAANCNPLMGIWFGIVLPELGHGEEIVYAAQPPMMIFLFQHHLQELSYGDVPWHCALITLMISVMYIVGLGDRDVKRDCPQRKRHGSKGSERDTVLLCGVEAKPAIGRAM